MNKIFLVFFLVIVFIAKSQQIRITLINDKKVVLENINVQLQKNGNTIDFKKTNPNGQCIFEISEPGLYGIKLTSMFYKTKISEIDTKEKTSFEIVLEPQITEIKEVEIKTRPKIAFQKQDTISYNIKAVKDGTERSAEDLIKKLPGLDVNENGKVTFKGSPIGQVLIDGNEFFGKNHKMATQNITAEMLEGVDLWQNYTTINGKRSTALNLKLKDEYKNHITGNLEANYGNKNSYLGHVNLFRFSKFGNLAFILDANNIAKDPISFMDFHEINTQENIDQGDGITRIDAPSFLNNDGKVKSKDNQLGALQYSKARKTFSISLYSVFNTAQLSKFSETLNTVFENQPQSFNFIENHKENNKGFFGTAQLKLKKTFNDKSYLYYNFGYNPTVDTFTQNINRHSLKDNYYAIDNPIQRQSISHFISWNKTWERSAFIFSYNHFIENQKNDLSIVSAEPLFLTSQNAINQRLNNENHQHSFDFYWKNTNEVLNFNFHSGFKSQLREIRLEEFTTNEIEHNTYDYQFFTNDLFLRKQFGNFDFSTALKSQFLTVNSLKNHYFEPTFRIKFSPPSKIKMEYSMEFNQAYEIPETLSLLSSNVYDKEINYQKNRELTPTLLSKTTNYRFLWNRFNLSKGNFLFIVASYTESQPVFSRNTINYGLFSENQMVIGDKNKQWLFVISDDRVLSKTLLLKTKLNYFKNETNNFINSQSNITESQNTEIGQKLSTKFTKFPVQFDFGYSLRYWRFHQSLFNSQAMTQNLKFSLGTRAQIKETWKMNILGEYLYQKTDTNRQGNFLLSGQLSYQKKESKTEYNLSFNNVLHLNSFQYINRYVSSIGKEDATVIALHGYILGGLKFYF